jgi:NADH-quinone oxidoreductase subunit F
VLAIARAMEGKTICVFADAAAWPVQSYIRKFRKEFEAHIQAGASVAGGEATTRSDAAVCRP